MRGGDQCHALNSLPQGKRPNTECTGGWEGPRVSLNWCRKSHPHQNLIPTQSSQ